VVTVATIIFLFILALLSMFQIALAFGAPIGRFAWGGQHQILPPKLRFGSIVSLAFYTVFAIAIISKSFQEIIPRGQFLDALLWCITTYLVLGVFMNAVSRSKSERYTMTPLTIILVLCILVVIIK
jgi:uncharacterized membrane protein SirB2